MLDWLFPPRCGGCGSIGSWLCASCWAAVRRLEEPLCPRCGRELEFQRERCSCREQLTHLRRLRAAAAYEGPLERALQALKYGGRSRLAPMLAGLLLDRLAVEGLPATLLLSVPLHRGRERARGYNQAELLARELRRALGLGLPSGRLVRVRPTPPQVGLDRVSRRANVANAFRWSGLPLGGEAVAVVDDIATTGATLDACAAALRAAGSGFVTGLSVARVRI